MTLEQLLKGILKETKNLDKLLKESKAIQEGNLFPCECCAGTGQVDKMEAIWDEDSHQVSYEETGKKLPCPDCQKEFYNN
jgi:hypothetical protein